MARAIVAGLALVAGAWVVGLTAPGCEGSPSNDDGGDAGEVVDAAGDVVDASGGAPADATVDAAKSVMRDAAVRAPDLALLPLVAPTSSLLVGGDIARLRGGWKLPVDPRQAAWKAEISSRADGAALLTPPGVFGDAANWSSIAQARALRWLMDPAALTAAADRASVVAILGSAALPGGSTITRPEVAMNYLAAYDLINAGLSGAERATISARLSGGAFWQALDAPLQVNNQLAKWASTRGFAALLFAMDGELSDRLGDIGISFLENTTDDGWYTDAPTHYLNYALAQLAPFALALKNGTGRELSPRLAAFVTMSLGLRLPNGLVPSVQNGANTGVAIHLLARGLADPALAAAAYWNLTELGAFDWTSWTNVFNNDASYTDFFWAADFAVAAAPPAMSPTWFSGGQARVATFRGDWGRASHYLNLSAGIDGKGGAGFGQMNTAAIVVAASGTEVLVEPGYDREDLSTTPAGFNSRPAIEHNVLLARDTGTAPWGIGGDGDYQTNTGSAMVMSDTLDGGEAGGHHGVCDFARLSFAYGGVGAGAGVAGRRSVAFAGEDYFIVADVAHAAAGPAKDYAVNLIGKGPLTKISGDPALVVVGWEVTKYGTYNGGHTVGGEPYDRPVNGRVIAHLTATAPLSLATDTTWMHENYDRYQQTNRMRAAVTGVADAALLDVLEVSPAGVPARLLVTSLSTQSYAAAAVVDMADGWNDTLLSQASAAVRTVGPLLSDGEFAWIRERGGALSAAMCSRGARMDYRAKAVWTTSAPVTMSLAFGPQVGRIGGTLSGDKRPPMTVLRLYGHGHVTAATFEGRPMVVDNTDPNFAVVTLPDGPGGFELSAER